MEKGREAFSLGLVLALFFALSLYQLHLPGLYYDEAADAVPAMQLLYGQRVELVRDSGLQLGSVTLPVMVMDYVGAVNTYLLLPFFKIMGVSVFALRSMTIAMGAATLILTYLLTRKLINKRVAFMSVLLLAAHPSFVFYGRQGVHVSSIMVVAALGSLLAFAHWRGSGSPYWLWTGALLLGLGLSAKVLFLWFILALSAIYAMWQAAERLRPRPLVDPAPESALDLRQGLEGQWAHVGWSLRGTMKVAGIWVVGAMSFAVGAWMPIYYNYRTQGTLEALLQNARVTSHGIDNLNVVQNLAARAESFRALLDGGHFWFLGGLFSFEPFPWVFAASTVVAGGGSLFWTQGRRYGKTAWLFLGLILLVFVQSAFTISGIWPTHLFILLPFVALLIALAAAMISDVAPPRLNRLLPLSAVVMLVAGSLYVDYRYHHALSESGGRLAQSDAIYQLAEYLDERQSVEPAAMDWGIKTSVQILTQGRANPIEIFGYSRQPDEGFGHRLYSLLADPDRLYVFHGPQATSFPRYDAFLAMVNRLERSAVLEYTAAERNGAPVYLVYKVQ